MLDLLLGMALSLVQDNQSLEQADLARMQCEARQWTVEWRFGCARRLQPDEDEEDDELPRYYKVWWWNVRQVQVEVYRHALTAKTHTWYRMRE